MGQTHPRHSKDSAFMTMGGRQRTRHVKTIMLAAVWRTDCRRQCGSRKVTQEAFLTSRYERKVAGTQGVVVERE